MNCNKCHRKIEDDEDFCIIHRIIDLIINISKIRKPYFDEIMAENVLYDYLIYFEDSLNNYEENWMTNYDLFDEKLKEFCKMVNIFTYSDLTSEYLHDEFCFISIECELIDKIFEASVEGRIERAIEYCY
jgi:hypothetical protein